MVTFYFSADKNAKIKQDEICGSICEILGLKHDKRYNDEILKAKK